MVWRRNDLNFINWGEEEGKPAARVKELERSSLVVLPHLPDLSTDELKIAQAELFAASIRCSCLATEASLSVGRRRLV